MSRSTVFIVTLIPMLWLAKQVSVLLLLPWLLVLFWYFNRPGLKSLLQFDLKPMLNALYGERKKPEKDSKGEGAENEK